MMSRAVLMDTNLLDGMSNDPDKWKICDRDRFGMGSCIKKIKQCEKCGKNGHNEKRCPALRSQCFICGRSGHRIFRCPDRYCSVCFRRGHSLEECFRAKAKCSVCSCVGHMSEFCSVKWKRFLTVTDVNTYEKHAHCDVKSDDCDVCSFSRWSIMNPTNQTPYIPPNITRIPQASENIESAVRGPKRKANSNLRPKNAAKKLKNSSNLPAISQPFIKFEPSSDEDDLDTFEPFEMDSSTFNLSQLIPTDSSLNITNPQSFNFTNRNVFQESEEENFFELLQDSTWCNTEPLKQNNGQQIAIKPETNATKTVELEENGTTMSKQPQATKKERKARQNKIENTTRQREKEPEIEEQKTQLQADRTDSEKAKKKIRRAELKKARKEKMKEQRWFQTKEENDELESEIKAEIVANERHLKLRRKVHQQERSNALTEEQKAQVIADKKHYHHELYLRKCATKGFSREQKAARKIADRRDLRGLKKAQEQARFEALSNEQKAQIAAHKMELQHLRREQRKLRKRLRALTS